jgi:hypothetical protein
MDKYRVKVVEKREWRTNVEKCWNIQEKLNNCITNSENFKTLDSTAQKTILDSTSKSFIWNYVNMWARGGYKAPQHYENFFNTSSPLWISNENNLIGLNNECNLFSLYECCRDTFDLNNLKGNYEYYNRNLKQ